MKENRKVEIENEVFGKSNSPMKWLIMVLASLALVIRKNINLQIKILFL